MGIKGLMKGPLDVMLYRFSPGNIQPVYEWPESYLGYKLIIYKPGLFTLGKYGLNPFINFLWYLITKGDIKVLLLFDGNVMVHSFYISPKTYRYSYMGKNDINLAQAMTKPEYQGKGILTNVLKLITSYYAGKSADVWVYCHISNMASQKANVRAGFEFVGYAKLSRFTRIVRIVKYI
jgi:hypothetical protein